MGDPSRRQFMMGMSSGVAAFGLTGFGASPVGPRTGEVAIAPAAEGYPGAGVEPVAAEWDMSWVEKVTGTYRMVFDAPEIAEGTVLHQARVYLSGYAEVHGTKDQETSAVLVIRHAAIPMVANDRLWDELELGKRFKVKDAESGKPARRNPFLNANAPRGAKHAAIWPDGGLDTLIGRGSIALACNLALFRLVRLIAEKDKVENPAARQKALANLVPGVIVQPSGIFAVARAQAAGCDYIRAT